MDRYRIEPGTRVELDRVDPDDRSAIDVDKEKAKRWVGALNERLESLQELLWAEGKQKLLIVLQAMDAGGKDSTIRHVFDGVNPQGVKVWSFKVPTPVERAHDYLWRVHACTPGAGEMAIFNRSHYEDVLVVRVKNLVPEQVWSRRYEQINNFEKMLVEEGTTIVKFFLHISKDEQRERFQSRLDERHKRWKFRRGDLDDRALWDDYRQAYEDMLSRTSTVWAPWYVVPANRKWYRNLVISQVLVDTLEELEMTYPDPEGDLDDVVID